MHAWKRSRAINKNNWLNRAGGGGGRGLEFAAGENLIIWSEMKQRAVGWWGSWQGKDMAPGPVLPVLQPICRSGLGHEMEASARREERRQPPQRPQRSPASCGVPSHCPHLLGTRRGYPGTAVLWGWIGTQSIPEGDCCILVLCPPSQAATTTGVCCKI